MPRPFVTMIRIASLGLVLGLPSEAAMAQGRRVVLGAGLAVATHVTDSRTALSGGIAMRLGLAQEDRPDLLVELGLLARRGDDDRACFVGPCPVGHTLDGILLLRGGLAWSVPGDERWYTGGGIAGYLPTVGVEFMPTSSFAVEGTFGRRGVWWSDSFVELRLGVLTARRSGGMTIQLQAGIMRE